MFFLLISVVIMAFWLQRYLSTNKLWYFQTSSSAIAFGVARFWYYVVPFMAVAFICFGLGGYWGNNPYDPAYKTSTYWTFAGLGSIVIGIICGFLKPTWLAPSWLRRLKREHGDVTNLLLEDSIGMEKKELERRLETREAIEVWIAEVRRKHGL